MKLFIFFFLFLANLIIAQSADSLGTKKWAIGLSGSADYCYQIPYKSKSNSGYIGNDTKAKAGITVGLNILYTPIKSIGIEMAVLYSTKGVVTHMPSWITPGGTYDPAIPNYGSSTYEPEKQVKYTYQYFEIPLKVNYYVLNKRFKVFPTVGVSANLFIGKKTMTSYKYSEGWKNETSHYYNSSNIPKVEIGLLLGIGFSYDLNKNLFVKLEPSYRQFIRPLVDTPVRGYLYSVGINTGIYFRI